MSNLVIANENDIENDGDNDGDNEDEDDDEDDDNDDGNDVAVESHQASAAALQAGKERGNYDNFPLFNGMEHKQMEKVDFDSYSYESIALFK